MNVAIVAGIELIVAGQRGGAECDKVVGDEDE